MRGFFVSKELHWNEAMNRIEQTQNFSNVKKKVVS